MSRGPLYDESVGSLRVTAGRRGRLRRVTVTLHRCEGQPRPVSTMAPSDARQLAQALTVAAARAEQAGEA